MRRLTIALVASGVCLITSLLHAQSAATLVSKDNRVDLARGGSGWAAASAGQSLNVGDRLKTGEESRAVVRMADGSVLQLDELTTIEIKPPKGNSGATLNMPSGAGYFFSRGGAGREVAIETPSANGAIRGTAFLLAVNRTTGGTAVSMIEGAFNLTGSGGSVTARQGEQARAGAEGTGKSIYGDTGDTAPWYLVVENHLPAVQHLRGANKSELLTALSGGISQFQQVAPQMSGGTTIVRREWATDVLREAFKAVGSNCGMRGRILHSIIAAAPDKASELTELAVALGPECASAFGGGGTGTPPSSQDEGDFGDAPPSLGGQVPLPGTIIGGGGQGNVVAICHNGRTIFVSPQGAEAHLNNHPGDTLGACQVTPNQNP